MIDGAYNYGNVQATSFDNSKQYTRFNPPNETKSMGCGVSNIDNAGVGSETYTEKRNVCVWGGGGWGGGGGRRFHN